MHPGFHSTVQEIGRHQKFEGNFPRDGEFRDLCTTVSIAYLVGEILTHLREDVGSKNSNREMTSSTIIYL